MLTFKEFTNTLTEDHAANIKQLHIHKLLGHHGYKLEGKSEWNPGIDYTKNAHIDGNEDDLHVITVNHKDNEFAHYMSTNDSKNYHKNHSEKEKSLHSKPYDGDPNVRVGSLDSLKHHLDMVHPSKHKQYIN